MPVQPGQSAARRSTKRDRVRRRRSCLYIICLMSVCVVCLRTDSARRYSARCRATVSGRAPWLLRVVLHHGGDVSDWRALSGVVEMCPPPWIILPRQNEVSVKTPPRIHASQMVVCNSEHIGSTWSIWLKCQLYQLKGNITCSPTARTYATVAVISFSLLTHSSSVTLNFLH